MSLCADGLDGSCQPSSCGFSGTLDAGMTILETGTDRGFKLTFVESDSTCCR